MNLNPDELIPAEAFFFSRLNGSSTKGSYSTLQFVLRLRDDIRKSLDRGEVDEEGIKANSTSIHENIHWWQHIGSNLGLLLSLAGPGFASMCFDPLKGLIEKDLKYKSIIKYDRLYHDTFKRADIDEINLILNTYYDIEYAKSFLFDNKTANTIVGDHRFFLNMGHCFHIFWSKGIDTIASTIDREYDFLPNIDVWSNNFKDLSERKIDGFYIDSPMFISPIGIRAIYEGQAIFNQLQYLTLSLGPDLEYNDFKNLGMLHGIYLDAFTLFLKITQFEEPESLLEPVVGLFLIVCDISINPTNGFPLQIYDYENFIYKNDPGIRFTLLCKSIKESDNDFLDMIKIYSKEEYIKIEEKLSLLINSESSYQAIETVLKWRKNERISELLEEEKIHSFTNYNFQVRVLFSKFIRFQEDKYEYPHVFCWFGIYASSRSKNIDYKIVDNLFRKHHALFIDDYDDEIKPVIFEGKDQTAISQTFNIFYQYTIMFDMILKWVCEEGEFQYDYKWLSNKPRSELISIIKENFTEMFKISPDQILIVKDNIFKIK